MARPAGASTALCTWPEKGMSDLRGVPERGIEEASGVVAPPPRSSQELTIRLGGVVRRTMILVHTRRGQADLHGEVGQAIQIGCPGSSHRHCSHLSFIGIYRAAFTESGSGDFQWSPSRLVLDRENPYKIYLDLVARDALRSEESPFILNQHADYPASTYVLLWPYAAFDSPVAKNLWLVSNLLLTAVFLIGIFHLSGMEVRSTRLWLIVLFVSCTPFRAALGNGQHGFFSLAFVVLAVIFARRNRVLSGLFLALSWLKFTLTLPLSLFFVVRRRFDILAVALVSQLFLWFLASWWIGSPTPSVVADYVEALSKFPVTGDIDTFGVLVKLGLPAESLAPYAMFVLFILTGIIALGMRDDEDLLILSFLAIASCIVLVHHEYDNIVLAIPLAYVLSKKVIDVPTISFLLCIVSAWYARKILSSLGNGCRCMTVV